MPMLLVLLKYPKPGNVKTRLAESIGTQSAAELYRHWIDIVFAHVQPLRDGVRVVAYYAGAPLASFSDWHSLADEWTPQPDSDLGTRLAVAFERSNQPVVAIGTDCLDLDVELLQDAFARLIDHDAVFGPAFDGGYYLVGTSRNLPEFFSNIPWSSRETLSSHVAWCQRNGWSVSLLPERRDIDTLEDWQRHCEKDMVN